MVRRRGSGVGSGLAAGLVLAGLGFDQVGGVLQVAVDALDSGFDAVFLFSVVSVRNRKGHGW